MVRTKFPEILDCDLFRPPPGARALLHIGRLLVPPSSVFPRPPSSLFSFPNGVLARSYRSLLVVVAGLLYFSSPVRTAIPPPTPPSFWFPNCRSLPLPPSFFPALSDPALSYPLPRLPLPPIPVLADFMCDRTCDFGVGCRSQWVELCHTHTRGASASAAAHDLAPVPFTVQS